MTLNAPDSITPAGKTHAYTHMVNGKNKTADTVLYEKNIGEKSYYVVQAIPDTKAKTLYIVTAFIGKKGYKKEDSQLINAKSLDATAKTESANASVNTVSQDSRSVKRYQERTVYESARDVLLRYAEDAKNTKARSEYLGEYVNRVAALDRKFANLESAESKLALAVDSGDRI